MAEVVINVFDTIALGVLGAVMIVNGAVVLGVILLALAVISPAVWLLIFVKLASKNWPVQ